MSSQVANTEQVWRLGRFTEIQSNTELIRSLITKTSLSAKQLHIQPVNGNVLLKMLQRTEDHILIRYNCSSTKII